jgi:hypothetical protein
MGTGAIVGDAALAPNVGAGNGSVNLNGNASIIIPHDQTDVSITTSYASPWLGDHTDNRFIADVTVSIWFRINAMPTGANKAVIVSKSHTATPGTPTSYCEVVPLSSVTPGSNVSGGSLETYFDSAGAVHLEVRSFRGHRVKVSTSNNSVSVGPVYHLVFQLGYDGITAWLNGAKFEDGYANALHVFGLSADILGSLQANTNDWMIGKAAWGGQADLIVEAANGPLTPPADDILADRGVRVLPDILANAGGVTVSYFEWLQDINRRQWSRERVVSELESEMVSAWDSVKAEVEERDLRWREAAYVVALERIGAAKEARGLWP